MKPGINRCWIQREALGGGGGGGGLVVIVTFLGSSVHDTNSQNQGITAATVNHQQPPETPMSKEIILFLGGKRGSYRVMIN